VWHTITIKMAKEGSWMDNIKERIGELAEKGRIEGGDAFYLINGQYPEHTILSFQIGERTIKLRDMDVKAELDKAEEKLKREWEAQSQPGNRIIQPLSKVQWNRPGDNGGLVPIPYEHAVEISKMSDMKTWWNEDGAILSTNEEHRDWLNGKGVADNQPEPRQDGPMGVCPYNGEGCSSMSGLCRGVPCRYIRNGIKNNCTKFDPSRARGDCVCGNEAILCVCGFCEGCHQFPGKVADAQGRDAICSKLVGVDVSDWKSICMNCPDGGTDNCPSFQSVGRQTDIEAVLPEGKRTARPDGSKEPIDTVINDLMDKGILCEVCGKWTEDCICVTKEKGAADSKAIIPTSPPSKSEAQQDKQENCSTCTKNGTDLCLLHKEIPTATWCVFHSSRMVQAQPNQDDSEL